MALPTWATILAKAFPGAKDAIWRVLDGFALWLKEQIPDASTTIDEGVAKAKADMDAKLNEVAAESALIEAKDQLAHLIATHQSPAPPDVGDLA